MQEDKQLTEHESLALITNMIQRAKGSHHDTGVSLLLWGTCVFVASIVTYLQQQYNFDIGFDIWLLLIVAIIPQVFIKIKERKLRLHKHHTDIALDAVWITYAITIFGLVLYGNVIPKASAELIQQEGWQLIRHYTDSSQPDEIIKPFAPSIYSLYILVYAIPTLITGVVKKFSAMIFGACVAYVCFIASCFTAMKYDMLLGALTVIFCWIIPGFILRKKMMAKRSGNV
jgi:hypothetical protein